MQGLVKYSNYGEYKKELDNELQKTAEGFVRIGYLLKQAVETDILKESPYKTVNEFAMKEYGLDKSQVSRFIRINNRFAEDGGSDRLKEEYKGFGYAKLAIMLQLPDEIVAELTPEYSKSEIQEIKEELDEEKKITDIEVLMEEKDSEQVQMDSTIDKFMYQLGKEHPETYVEIWKAAEDISDDITNESTIKALAEVLAPDGQASYNVRVSGMGRISLYIKGTDVDLALINMRHPEEKEFVTWEQLADTVHRIAGDAISAKKSWEELYGEDYPEKKEEVAPVQQKAESRKQSRVVKAVPKPQKRQWKSPEIEKCEEQEKVPEVLHDIEESIPVPDPAEKVTEKQQEEDNSCDVQQEEQIPGQDEVQNHPEWVPGKKESDSDTGENQEEVHIQAVNITEAKEKAEKRTKELAQAMNVKAYGVALRLAEELTGYLKIIEGEE